MKVNFLLGTQFFDISTITAILESSLDYIGQEFIDYTIQNRIGNVLPFLQTQTNEQTFMHANKNGIARRSVRQTDIEAYKELVLEYNA